MKAITIKSARITGPLCIELVWSTGETLRADMAGWLRPPFDALQDPALFGQMQRDDWGHGLGWPGGLDLGADTLYELCRQQAGLPTARSFDPVRDKPCRSGQGQERGRQSRPGGLDWF